MDKVSENKRLVDFNAKYGTSDKKLVSVDKHFPAKLQKVFKREPSAVVSPDEVADIVLSYAKEDFKYASFLQAAIKDAAPKLVVKMTTKAEKDRLSLMESARRVVAFLSPNYLDSPEQVEEFNIALCRERISPTNVLFPITLHALPPQPAYIHIVPTEVNITDAMWAGLASKWNVNVPVLDMLDMPGLRSQGVYLPAEVALGLHEAACILIADLKYDHKSNALPTPRPVLHNVLKIQDDLKSDGSTNQTAGVELAKMLITLSISSDETIKDILGDDEIHLPSKSEEPTPAVEKSVDAEETETSNTMAESQDQEGGRQEDAVMRPSGSEEISPLIEEHMQEQEHSNQSLNGEPKTKETITEDSDQNGTHRPKSEGPSHHHKDSSSESPITSTPVNGEAPITSSPVNDEAHITKEPVANKAQDIPQTKDDKETTAERELQRRPKSAACKLL